MKKTIVLGYSLVVLSTLVSGQSLPGQWSFNAKKITATKYEIHYSLKIDAPWHVYSQFTPDGGPVPTSFTINKNPLLITDSKPKEVGKLKLKHEEVFGIDVKYFEETVDFVQKVKLKSNANTAITGVIEFMLCNDKQCLPPTKQNFNISLK